MALVEIKFFSDPLVPFLSILDPFPSFVTGYYESHRKEL
jgi:hypothetical protein